MREMPLVSVLICAYNTEKYIEECLDAVINQTYKNLEIVVVNDGSKDNTLSLIRDFAEKDARIKIIDNKDNIGFVASLNIGIENIRGEYVARTDADDFTKPDWIEKIVNRMLSQPEIIAMRSYLTILSLDGNGSNLADYYDNGEEWKTPLVHEEICQTMLFRNPIHNNSMIVKSMVFKKYGLRFDQSYKHAEDYKFWLEVSRIGRLANYPESLVYYRLHNGQTSSVYQQTQTAIAKKIRKEAINYYLSDLGLKNRLGEKIIFDDVVRIQAEFSRFGLLNQSVVVDILYDCYLSLENNRLFDAVKFLMNKGNSVFTRERRARIIKRILRPYKYAAVL